MQSLGAKIIKNNFIVLEVIVPDIWWLLVSLVNLAIESTHSISKKLNYLNFFLIFNLLLVCKKNKTIPVAMVLIKKKWHVKT